MPAMSRPSPATTRLLLVADRDHRRGRPAEAPVRRYRLARLRLEGPPEPVERQAHPRRSFD
jgi:hypothetical protein